MNHPVFHIVAIDKNNGIGKGDVMPWSLPGDMHFFQQKTTKTKDNSKQNMVIMGRTTWESIPEKHRPLTKRKNVVLTRKKDYRANGATVVHSIDEAFNLADTSIERVYIMGGASVYSHTIDRPEITGLYVTHIDRAFDCDAFYPKIPSVFSESKKLGEDEDNGIQYEFILHTKV